MTKRDLAILVHPVLIWLARAHRVWDSLHDLLATAFALTGAALVLGWHWPVVQLLLP